VSYSKSYSLPSKQNTHPSPSVIVSSIYSSSKGGWQRHESSWVVCVEHHKTVQWPHLLWPVPLTNQRITAGEPRLPTTSAPTLPTFSPCMPIHRSSPIASHSALSRSSVDGSFLPQTIQRLLDHYLLPSTILCYPAVSYAFQLSILHAKLNRTAFAICTRSQSS
jgi:hypothetical protein